MDLSFSFSLPSPSIVEIVARSKNLAFLHDGWSLERIFSFEEKKKIRRKFIIETRSTQCEEEYLISKGNILLESMKNAR